MIILNNQNDIIYSMMIINDVPDDQNVMVVIIIKDIPGDQMILSFL